MLPVQRYHTETYPPDGPRWVQFGDDILTSATDDARAALQRRHQWKHQFHIGRLQEQGMMPVRHRETQTPAEHRDPEDDAVETFDRPPPPPPPPSRERDREAVQRRLGPPMMQIDPPVDVPTPTLGGSFGNRASSTLSEMGAGLVHGTTWMAGATAGALAKGLARGVSHLISGRPAAIGDGDGDDEAPEPLNVDSRPAAKARSQPSRGSHESPHPWPAPSRPFVDPSSYNGTGVHAIYIGTDEEDEAPGPAAAAARPRGRPVAQRDVRLAQETLAANANYGRGHRRRGA